MAAAKRVLLTRAWPASDGSATDEALIASLPLEPHSCTLKTALQCNCIALHLSVHCVVCRVTLPQTSLRSCTLNCTAMQWAEKLYCTLCTPHCALCRVSFHCFIAQCKAMLVAFLCI